MFKENLRYFNVLLYHLILPVLTQPFCSTGVLMGQQHVWTAGSHQQSCYCPSAGQGALQEVEGGEQEHHCWPVDRVVVALDRLAAGLGDVGLCVAAL